MTNRLPKVVITIQTAMDTAINTVNNIPNGAGQQLGPQSWIVTPSPPPVTVTLAHSDAVVSRLEFHVPGIHSGGARLLVTVLVRAVTVLDTRLVAVLVVVSRKPLQMS